MEYSEYRDGIERARADGLIVDESGNDGNGPRDIFNHLPDKQGFGETVLVHNYTPGALNFTNTRRLSSLGYSALTALATRESVDVLVLGHGAGSECADIDRTLRTHGKRKDSKIHSAGLTPFSPFHPLHSTASEIAEIIERNRDNPALSGEIKDMLRQAARSINEFDKYSFTISIYFVLGLQKYFEQQIMDATETPFCDRQFIGRFPQSMPTNQQYDLVYESFGPLIKANLMERNAVAAAIIAKLKDNGIFIFKKDAFTPLEATFKHEAVTMVIRSERDASADGDCFVVRRDSEIDRRLQKEYGNWSSMHNRIIFGDTSEMIQSLALLNEKE